MHGWGSYKFINGNEYHGQWESDKFIGTPSMHFT
jgi:hypothetical protein